MWPVSLAKKNFQNLATLLGLPIHLPSTPRYNIAPSQLVACVRTNLETSDYEFVELKWGLPSSYARGITLNHECGFGRICGTEKDTQRRRGWGFGVLACQTEAS